MRAVPRQRAGSAPTPWDLAVQAERVLLAVAGIALLVAAALVVVAPSVFGLPSLADGDVAGRVLGAVGLYALSHILRFLRLALLIHHPGIRTRRVLQVHLLTTGVGVLLPFKLGELLRVREVGVLAGRLRTGLLAVWLERSMDAAALLLLIAVAAVGAPESLGVLGPLLAVMGAFVLVTVILVTVVPANIRELMLHIVRRPTGEGSIRALGVLRASLDALHEVPVLVRGKLPTLLLLTALVWVAEALTISVALSVELRPSELSAAVLALLSGVSSGATALSGAAADRLVEALQGFGMSADVGRYRLALALVALLGGAAAAAAYLPRRLRG